MNKILGESAFELLATPMDVTAVRSFIEAHTLPQWAAREPMALSRRGVLMGMTAISATMAMTGCAGQALAASAPTASKTSRLLWSLEKKDFVQLAKWFVKDALPSILFDVDDEDEAVKVSEDKRPGGTPFHCGFASIYQIHKPIQVIQTRYGFCLGLGEDGFLRTHPDKNIPPVKDLNGAELRRIKHLHKKNNELLVFACGPRESPELEEKVRFGEHCQSAGLNRDDWELLYCRNMNDGTHLYRGFGIQNKGIESEVLKGGTDILIGDMLQKQ